MTRQSTVIGMHVSPEIVSILAVGVALAGLTLTGLRGVRVDMRTEINGLRGEVDGLRGDVADLRAEVAKIRAEVAELRERVARLEGMFEGFIRSFDGFLNKSSAMDPDAN